MWLVEVSPPSTTKIAEWQERIRLTLIHGDVALSLGLLHHANVTRWCPALCGLTAIGKADASVWTPDIFMLFLKVSVRKVTDFVDRHYLYEAHTTCMGGKFFLLIQAGVIMIIGDISMAKETKFIKCSPSETNETIELWQSFGWELMGAPQEIFNQNTRLTGRSEEKETYTTTTTNYVKITFQRDKNMPNYAELVDLEQEYENIPSPPRYPNRFGFIWRIVAFGPTILGLLILLGGAGATSLVLLFPGVAIIVWRCVRYKKISEECDKQRNEIYSKENELVRRAQALLT